MERFFNTAGPIKPEQHYHIPLLKRIDWDDIQILIAQERYFVLHAPRQTGKTSTLLAMMAALNRQGKYATVYVNIEGAQAARGDVGAAIPSICRSIAESIEFYLGDSSGIRRYWNGWRPRFGTFLPIHCWAVCSGTGAEPASALAYCCWMKLMPW